MNPADCLAVESRELFYNLIRNNPFGVYLVDGDFRLAVVSRGSEKVFENVRPLIGRDFAEVLRFVWEEPFASDAIGRFRHTLETGEPYSAPSTIERRSDIGEVESYDWRIERVTLSDGDYGVVCYFYDLSERSRHEIALRESEARFREVANAAPVLIWLADTANQGIWYNKAWLDFTGRTMEQELGSGWLEGVHPDDVARCAEICGGSFDRRKPFRLDFRLRRADGEWRTVDDSGVPRFDESGNFLGYIGSCVDVTDARLAEAAVRASEERYRRIFEQTSDLILTADLAQVITDCNPSAAAAVGLTRAQVIGRKISDFVSTEDYALTSQMLRRKLEQGGTTRYDVRVKSSTGGWRFWEINSGLTFDETASPVGLHVVARDITERRQWEQHQRLLVGELNHRVKNTLAIVQSLAHQTFAGDRVPKQIVSAFEGRLRALANAHNLLTSENWESADLRTLIHSTLSVHAADGDRLRLDGPALRLIPQAAVTIAIALHELATNAVKYGALSIPGGKIAVTWSADDGRLDLQWAESGGPPVARPERTGFGSRMIERALPRDLRGKVDLEYAPSGVVCRIEAPLSVCSEPAS